MKIDKNGKLLWSKIYAGPLPGKTFFESESAESILELPDHSIYLCGQGNSSTHQSAATLLKFDSTGNVLWSKAYDSTAGDSFKYIQFRTALYDSVKKAINISCEYQGSVIGAFRGGVIRVDTSGNIILGKSFGPATIKQYEYYSLGHNLLQLPSGHFVLLQSAFILGKGEYFHFIKMDSGANSANCNLSVFYLTPSPYPIKYLYSYTSASANPTVGSGCKVIPLIQEDSLFCAPFIAGFGWLNPCSSNKTMFYDSSYFGPTNWQWNFGDPSSGNNNTSTLQNPFHVFAKAGTYTVHLVSGNGKVTDSLSRRITILQSPIPFVLDTLVCNGSAFTLHATGGDKYIWHPANLVSDSTSANPTAQPNGNTRYIISAYANNGCMIYDTIWVHFDKIPAAPTIDYTTVASYKEIDLQFHRSSSNDVKVYYLYRNSNSGIYKKIASFTNLTNSKITYYYADTLVRPASNNYAYKVVAIDSCGASGDTSFAHAPVLLKGSAGELRSILIWTKYLGYSYNAEVVERYDTAAHKWIYLDYLYNKDSNDIDSNYLKCNKTVYYRIATYLNNGDVSYSDSIMIIPYETVFKDTVRIVTVTKTSTSTTSGTLIIRWKNNNKHVLFNQLYYSIDGKAFSLLKDSLPPKLDSFVHTGVNTQTADEYYYLLGVDSCPAKSPKSIVHKSMDLTVSVGQLLHKLNWTPYEGFKIDKYYVQQLIGGKFQIIDTVPGTDTSSKYFPAPCNSVVRYRIVAQGFNPGELSFSDTMGRQAIDTIPSDAAVFDNATLINNTKARIDFTGSDSLDTYDFVIQRSIDGIWGTAGTILFTKPGIRFTFIDSTINAQKNYICYTVLVRDSCLNTTLSDTFCLIKLTGSPENLSDSLKWLHYKGYAINNYYILRYISPTFWDTIGIIKGTDTLYLHKPIPCNVPVTYKIEGFEISGKESTLSNSFTLTPFDTIKPPQPSIKYVTVLNGSQIKISWNKSIPKVKLYELSITSSRGSWTIIDTVNIDSQYTFNGLDTHDSIYDFRIVVIDSCAANRSNYSIFHSSVYLTGKGQNLSNLLTWKKYEGFVSVRKYYIFQWANKWTLLDSVSGTTLSYLQKNLPCNVPQYYLIKALDNSGQYLSNSDSVQLIPFDTIEPPAPIIKYATVLSGSQIQLFWHRSIPKVKSYELSIKSGNGNWGIIDTVKIDTQYIFKGLDTPDSIYDFRIVAIDSCAANRSPFSQYHSPVQLGGNPMDNSVKLNWKPYEGFMNVKAYYIYHYESGIWVLVDSVPGNTTSWLSKTLPCNGLQNYRIGSLDNSAKYLSFSDTIQLIPFDTIKPTPPVLYYATVLPDQTVKLSWQWNPKSDVKYFEIWRASNNNTPVLIKTIIYDSSYIDKNVRVKDSIYRYYIIAIDSCNLANRSVPSVQNILMSLKLYSLFCKKQVQIKWTPYTGLPNSANEYEIYRSTDGINFTSIATLSASASSYTDTSVITGKQYFYKVEAVDTKSGYSNFSDTLATIPQIIPEADNAQFVYATVLKTDPKSGQIYIQWKRAALNDTNARGYYVYSYDSINKKYALLKDVTDLNDTTLVHSNLNTLQNTHKYYIITYNVCDVGGNSNIHKTVLLNVINGNLQANLHWTNYLGELVKNYKIYKSIDGGKQTLLKDAGLDTTYLDTNIYCNHTYTYQIQAILENGKISFSDSVTIKGIDTIKPITNPITLATVIKTGSSDGKIMLTWQKANSPLGARGQIAGYNIDRSNDSIVWNRRLNGFPGTSLLDSGLNTYRQPYYYRIQAIDSCGNLGGFSPVHKSINLKASAGNQFIQLIWNSYEGWKVKQYLIYKDGKLIATIGKETTNFMDSLVVCTQLYHYLIKAVCDTTNDTLISSSNTDSIKSFDHKAPGRVYIKTVTVSNPNKAVTLTWNPSPSFDTKNYLIYRKSGINGDMKLVDSTSQLTYIDSTSEIQAILQIPYNPSSDDICYYIFAQDHCGNISSGSNEGCVIILNAQNQKFYNDLSWNGYQTWYDGVLNYNVYKKEDNQPWNLIGTTTNGNIHNFTDKDLGDSTINFCYQVEAVENPGKYNQLSRSTVACVHQGATVFIPNSFTHFNQDGLNDNFGPKGLYIKNYTMQIYNRWGELVYSTSAGKPWDGTFKGQEALEGVYIYLITIEDYNARKSSFNGNVTIFR